MNEKLDLVNFLPKVILTASNKECELNFKTDALYISLSYITETNNNAKIEFSNTIPRFISKNVQTFEVLGLLQAEMGKTQNGNLSFANSEPKIINAVMKWFEKELELNRSYWKWSIKLNLNEPENQDYKSTIEEKCINYWLKRSKLDISNSYPKKVSYIKDTKHKKLKNFYYGTLMIEF